MPMLAKDQKGRKCPKPIMEPGERNRQKEMEGSRRDRVDVCKLGSEVGEKLGKMEEEKELELGSGKGVWQESEISKKSQEIDNFPRLDLGFNEGQTIKLSIGNITTKEGGVSKPRTCNWGLSLLPPYTSHNTPPPGGNITIPPSSSSVAISNHVIPPPIQSNHRDSAADILLDLDSPAPVTIPAPAPVSASNDLWGDLSSASISAPNCTTAFE
ncbi:LOW QUALITY PROTEIN: adaptin ear-binding coat-associated protein 1-like [Erethizon dorsatum]